MHFRKKRKLTKTLGKHKKELSQIKAAYKKGRLKFNSKEVAKTILRDLKHGLTR